MGVAPADAGRVRPDRRRARGEWHEERFSAIYLDKTLAGTREATIMFADLQGYTSFTERTLRPEVATS